MHIPLFWWRDEPNFGDALSPWLIKKVFGYPVRWSSSHGKFVGLGSVLWAARPGDVVWGAGLHPDTELHSPNWSADGVTFLAVRGPLTREYVVSRHGVCPETYGDPAVLAPFYFLPDTAPRPSGVGVIPHFQDEDGRCFATSVRGAKLIDVRRPWREVINLIAGCEVVWSSSLHGIIVAEAYGVPAVWTCCTEGELKYRDYYLGSGRPDLDPVAWRDAAASTPPSLPARIPLDDHPLVRSLRYWAQGG